MTELLRPAARLLVEAVREDTEPIDEDQLAVPLDELVTAARMHRVGPALFRRARAAGNAPERWLGAFESARRTQLFRHMRASADLVGLTAALDTRGVRWAVAKGPVAADLIWPSPDMREYVDLDIFVDPADFANALDALETAKCGYVDRNWPELSRRMRAEIAFTGPEGTPVDLHWDMAVPPELRRDFKTDMTGMIARRRMRQLGTGISIPVFDPVDTVLHLAFHAAQAGATRLMWLGDLHYACRAEGFDWQELEQRAHAARAEVPLAIVLDRVDRVLGLDESAKPFIERGTKSVAGRFVRRRDAKAPLPALPEDRSFGGGIVSGARRRAVPSAVRMAEHLIETRRIERRLARNGPDVELLDLDVPDAAARRAYLDVVAGVGTVPPPVAGERTVPIRA